MSTLLRCCDLCLSLTRAGGARHTAAPGLRGRHRHQTTHHQTRTCTGLGLTCML